MTNRFRPTISSLAPLCFVLACAWFVGCAASSPPPPPPPPPPRALTVTPQRKQSRAQQDSDTSACQSMASGQATSSETWAQIFTSCMGGRGYMVQLPY